MLAVALIDKALTVIRPIAAARDKKIVDSFNNQPAPAVEF